MEIKEFMKDFLSEDKKERFIGKDKKALLDLDTLYFDDDINETGVAKDKDGNFSIKVLNPDEGYKICRKKSLGYLATMVSMISRLKAFNYPVDEIEFFLNNGKISVDMITKPKDVIKYYGDLRNNIARLRKKYGDKIEEHIDELYCVNRNGKKEKIENGETREQIDSSYGKLKRNFEQYKDSLSEEDKRKLEIALQIYGGSLFVSLNRIAAVQDYQNKTGAELIAECDKNEDFREHFHGKFSYFKRVLESPHDGSDKEVLKRWGELLDYSSEEKFAESIKGVLMVIDLHKDKVVVPEDMYVYRGFANDKPVDLMSLAESDIISTSLSRSVASGFSNKSNFSGKNRYMNYILVQKGTPYIMPITELGDVQKEIVFLGSAVNLEKVGRTTIDDEKSVNARTYIMSARERIIEQDKVNENSEGAQKSKIEVETLNVDAISKKSTKQVRTNDAKDDGVR